MDVVRLVRSLERFGGALAGLVRGLDTHDARWRPAKGEWSILEIVTHLADEEVEDFRTRVESTLADPTRPWPPIDPEGWAVERRYNEGRLEDAVARFERERRRSVEWLNNLHQADWSRTHEHPDTGKLRAGDLLVSWVAHDSLHTRQLVERFFQLATRDGGEYRGDYAGPWG